MCARVHRYLERVIVSDGVNAWLFNANRWLDEGKDDHKVID